MNYNIIVLDLDGTLTNRDKVITPRTKAALMRAQEAGKIVVLTTQVASEGSDLGVYHVGYRLKSDLGVLEAYDMTTEAVVAKLMWILGQTRDRAEVERLFYTPVARDILWLGM